MKSLIAICLFACIGVLNHAYAAPPIDLAEGDSMVVSCISDPCPATPPEYIRVKAPGNAHAVVHPAQAKARGYDSCTSACHNLTPNPDQAKVGEAGSFLCSQYDFCTSGNTAGRTQCQTGVTFKWLDTGETVADPGSGAPVVTGTTVGGYPQGATPMCRDCHYPHRTSNTRVRSSDVHEGCLDCHRRVGSSDLRNGIGDD